jgi:acylglycerol lipase
MNSSETTRPFSSFQYELPDGTKIQAWKLIPEQAKASIILIHGMGEHAQRYQHWANRFYQYQIAWYAFDLPGHGLSTGKKGHFKSLDTIFEGINQLIALIKQEQGEMPLILYGHSMGGNLALQFLLNVPHPFQIALVTSPWIRLVHPPARPMIWLATLMHHLFPGFTQGSGLKARDMSSQSTESQQYEKDPLNHKLISANSFFLIHQGGMMIERSISKLNIPLFLTHSSDDPLTSYNASKAIAKNHSFIEFHEFKEVRHELHNDIQRDELFRLEIEFIQKHLNHGV